MRVFFAINLILILILENARNNLNKHEYFQNFN